MRTLQEKYNGIQEGKFSKENFLADARRELPNLVTRFNGYDDAVQILKNRGMIQEAAQPKPTKKGLADYRYKPTNEMDKYPYEQILRGLRVELEVMGISGTPTPEEYAKALAKVSKNLAKDSIFYTNQLAGVNPKVDLHDKMVDATAKNTVDTFNGMKKIKDLKENVSSLNNLPDGKYFAIDGDWEEEYRGHNGLFFTLKGHNLIGSDGKNFQTSPEEFLSQFTPDEILKVEDIAETTLKEGFKKLIKKVLSETVIDVEDYNGEDEFELHGEDSVEESAMGDIYQIAKEHDRFEHFVQAVEEEFGPVKDIAELEHIFNATRGEDDIDYGDENFSDPLIDGEDLFESKSLKDLL